MTTNATRGPAERTFTRSSSTNARAPSSAPLALHIEDLSGFTKALRHRLGDYAKERPTDPVPGHVSLLNILAKSAGEPNVQALKAKQPRPVPAATTRREPITASQLSANAVKAAMQFDDQGRLVRWPNKYIIQRLAMWVLWMRFDTKRSYTEREVNDVLKAWHTYGDHVTLRRELINMKLLGRKSDCSEYWKEPQRADEETRLLLAAMRERVRNHRAPLDQRQAQRQEPGLRAERAAKERS